MVRTKPLGAHTGLVGLFALADPVPLNMELVTNTILRTQAGSRTITRPMREY